MQRGIMVPASNKANRLCSPKVSSSIASVTLVHIVIKLTSQIKHTVKPSNLTPNSIWTHPQQLLSGWSFASSACSRTYTVFYSYGVINVSLEVYAWEVSFVLYTYYVSTSSVDSFNATAMLGVDIFLSNNKILK